MPLPQDQNKLDIKSLSLNSIDGQEESANYAGRSRADSAGRPRADSAGRPRADSAGKSRDPVLSRDPILCPLEDERYLLGYDS